MLTLAQMQKTAAGDLRAISLYATNRQYAIACDQMAAAQDAFKAGDRAAMAAHVERAKLAHLRAHEDERGQQMRAAATARAIEEARR